MLHCRLFVFSISTAVSSSVHDSSARLASSRPIGRSVKFSVWMTKEGGGRLAIGTKFLENDRINRTTFGQFVPRRTHVNSSLTTSWACRLAGGGLRKHRHIRAVFRPWRHRGTGRIEQHRGAGFRRRLDIPAGARLPSATRSPHSAVWPVYTSRRP